MSGPTDRGFVLTLGARALFRFARRASSRFATPAWMEVCRLSTISGVMSLIGIVSQSARRPSMVCR